MEEKDYRTAYSYLLEGFEGYNQLDDPLAVRALKYMLLCKIMNNLANEVHGLVTNKSGLKFAGVETEAMEAVAAAYKSRSVAEFESCLTRYAAQLKQDPVADLHLTALYNTLLEQNLVKLIEPFSCVEIDHVAKLIHLPRQTVEKKTVADDPGQEVPWHS
jgi:26S proteasome regulatory subunit N6